MFLLILYEISKGLFFFFSFAWTQNLTDLKEANIFLRLQLAKKKKKEKESKNTQIKKISHFFGKLSIIFKTKFH